MAIVTIEIEMQELYYDADLPEVGPWSISIRDSNNVVVAVYIGTNPWMSTVISYGDYTVTARRNDVDNNPVGPIATQSFSISEKESLGQTFIKMLFQ